jgi:hypothetical protein
VDGDQRRAGAVEDERRPVQSEQVGDAAGREVEAVAREVVGVDVLRAAEPDPVVVVGERRPEDHARLRAVQARRRDGGALERRPGHFEGEPVLRVEAQRLARRDAEEAGVEALDVGQQAGAARVDLGRRLGVGVGS